MLRRIHASDFQFHADLFKCLDKIFRRRIIFRNRKISMIQDIIAATFKNVDFCIGIIRCHLMDIIIFLCKIIIILLRNRQYCRCLIQDRFEVSEFGNFLFKIQFLLRIDFRFRQMLIIFMFNIMRSHYNISILEFLVHQNATAMQSFQKYRIIVLHKVAHQLIAVTGTDYIRQRVKQLRNLCRSLIIIYGVTKTFEIFRMFASIFKTMQMNFNASF